MKIATTNRLISTAYQNLAANTHYVL